MTKLDWNRAKQRAASGKPSSNEDYRQQALQQFVQTWHLTCFKCGTNNGPWATAKRTTRPDGTAHRWAICQTCRQADN